jgi:hypothetical protein
MNQTSLNNPDNIRRHEQGHKSMQTCTHMKCYLKHEKPTDTKQIEQGLCCKVIWD